MYCINKVIGSYTLKAPFSGSQPWTNFCDKVCVTNLQASSPQPRTAEICFPQPKKVRFRGNAVKKIIIDWRPLEKSAYLISKFSSRLEFQVNTRCFISNEQTLTKIGPARFCFRSKLFIN